MSARLREGRDADSEALIELIRSVFAEYPGCVLDVDREEPHLRRPASAFREWGGRLWVLEADRGLVASVAYRPREVGLELKHLYVSSAARRQGLGARLVLLVEAEALRRGAEAVELWTDTRFLDAHRLYERLGYSRTGGVRDLDDLSGTCEYHFRKRLASP